MMLHEALDTAVKERLIAKNPTNGTTIPKNNYPEKQVLGDEQLETFLEAIKHEEYWGDFFYVEVMTGLRRGEICGLKWSDVDFDGQKLRIERSVSVKKGGGVSIGETKTNTGNRTIIMPPSVSEILLKRKQMAITEWVFPAIMNPEQPIHPAAAYRKLKVILKHAELPMMRFHDLRHTFATHTTCRTALEKAVTEGLIRINPAIGCKLPPKKAKEMQVLTPPEITRFLIQAREEGYYELFLLELTTGMRRGEILALKWRDLNLKTGELHISRQVLKVNGKLLISTPKTKSSNRMILLPPEMLELLAELKTRTDSEWIFPSPLDLTQPRNPSAVYHRFQKILERANCKRVRFHDLRHTFATMALENGMDIKTLSAMIGHVSAETTLNIYSHITDTMQQQAARIDREIAGADTPIPEPNATDKASDSEATDQPTEPKFEPYKGKIRKPGTGCVMMINDHLYEGRFSPRVNGKRIAKNIYATTREECEEKLKVLIAEMKKEIAEIKINAKNEG